MIRHADLKDIDDLMSIMIDFANASPIPALHNPNFDDFRARKLLTHYICKGVVLVSYKEEEITGMLIATLVPDTWMPHIVNLREIAWYVKPKYRHSLDGFRLIKKYELIGQELMEDGLISNIVITTLVDTPVDITKRGWKEIETNYILEGKS